MGDVVLPASVAQADTLANGVPNGTSSHGSADAKSKENISIPSKPLTNGTTTVNPPVLRKNDVNRWVIPPFKGGPKAAPTVASANALAPTPRAGSLSHIVLSSARAVATPIIPLDRPSGSAASNGRRAGSVANIDVQSTVRANAKKPQGGSTNPNAITSAAPVTNGKNHSVLPNGTAGAGPSPPAASPAVTVPAQINGTTAHDQHQSQATASPHTPAQNQNMWQQATRKGHRKTKSSIAASPVSPAEAANGGSGGARFQSHGRLSATTAAVSGERKGG
jgi:hypothetical protein